MTAAELSDLLTGLDLDLDDALRSGVQFSRDHAAMLRRTFPTGKNEEES